MAGYCLSPFANGNIRCAGRTDTQRKALIALDQGPVRLLERNLIDEIQAQELAPLVLRDDVESHTNTVSPVLKASMAANVARVTPTRWL
jgi:hypothetical protein